MSKFVYVHFGVSTKWCLYVEKPHADVVLETDGSDDGWGVTLIQIIGGERRVIDMWSGQWKTVTMSPYYKETKTWMMGLEKVRMYTEVYLQPIRCVTDHIPLTWIKNTSGKGSVSQFVMDNLSRIDYEITYRPDKRLVEADVVSRYPCLGSRVFSGEDKMTAIETLFATLSKQWKLKGRTWIYTDRDTMLVREIMLNYQVNLHLV